MPRYAQLDINSFAVVGVVESDERPRADSWHFYVPVYDGSIPPVGHVFDSLRNTFVAGSSSRAISHYVFANFRLGFIKYREILLASVSDADVLTAMKIAEVADDISLDEPSTADLLMLLVAKGLLTPGQVEVLLAGGSIA